MPLLAKPACPAVISRNFEAALDRYSYRRGFAVVNDRGEFELKREFRRDKFQQVESFTRDELPQVNRSVYQFAVDDVTKMSSLRLSLSYYAKGNVQGSCDALYTIGRSQVDGHASIEQDLAA